MAGSTKNQLVDEVKYYWRLLSEGLDKVEYLARENVLLKFDKGKLEERIKELEVLAKKESKKGKRKVPKVEKRGGLIIFPVKKEVKSSH